MESLRKLAARVHGHFIAGTAVDVVMGERLLEVETMLDGKKRNFYVPYESSDCFQLLVLNTSLNRYDKLVIACGSISATHGVPGLENCFQLKTVSDALYIRKRLLGMHSL